MNLDLLKKNQKSDEADAEEDLEQDRIRVKRSRGERASAFRAILVQKHLARSCNRMMPCQLPAMSSTGSTLI